MAVRRVQGSVSRQTEENCFPQSRCSLLAHHRVVMQKSAPAHVACKALDRGSQCWVARSIPHAAESDWPIELESAEALDCEGGSRRGLAHDTGLVFWAETVLDPAEDDTGQYPCSWCSCWGPIQLWRELDRRPVRVAAERAHLRIASVRSPNSQRRALAITLLRSASREAPARARAAGLWSA